MDPNFSRCSSKKSDNKKTSSYLLASGLRIRQNPLSIVCLQNKNISVRFQESKTKWYCIPDVLCSVRCWCCPSSQCVEKRLVEVAARTVRLRCTWCWGREERTGGKKGKADFFFYTTTKAVHKWVGPNNFTKGWTRRGQRRATAHLEVWRSARGRARGRTHAGTHARKRLYFRAICARWHFEVFHYCSEGLSWSTIGHVPSKLQQTQQF